jgi:hypothetical protein
LKVKNPKMSAAQKERWAEYRRLEAEREAPYAALRRAGQDAARIERERKSWAEHCETDAACLLLLGEIWDQKTRQSRNAETMEEERASALRFAALLKVELPIGGTTTRDLLRRVFYEWCRVGRPLLNHFTNKFSDDWDFPLDAPVPVFEDVWRLIEPAEKYDELLPVRAS